MILPTEQELFILACQELRDEIRLVHNSTVHTEGYWIHYHHEKVTFREHLHIAHLLEGRLKEEQRRHYYDLLFVSTPHDKSAISATAPQRFEAYFRTVKPEMFG